ncbi:MAG: hypothetical protein ACD_15C00034G0008 [uncultured bacterium]|nr:MAG: hypothetical protein ACD_15C00034G0008 [uncultured bacterium]
MFVCRKSENTDSKQDMYHMRNKGKLKSVLLTHGKIIFKKDPFHFRSEISLKDAARQEMRQESKNNMDITKNDMDITSSAFENNALIPKKYTCDGENINPPLKFSHVSSVALSLVLIMHDPDAPKSGGWTHWTIFNIDPALTSIDENSIPTSAVQGMTDFGKPGYGGPCPPSVTHHYEFKLYALDDKLSLDRQATKEDLEAAMYGHIVEEAVLTGLYKRE